MPMIPTTMIQLIHLKVHYITSHLKVHYIRNAHGHRFAHLNINERDATLFCFTKKDGTSTKLFVVEVGNQENPLHVQSEINFQQQNDFIVGMVPASKYGHGTLFLYDIQTGRNVCHISV